MIKHYLKLSLLAVLIPLSVNLMAESPPETVIEDSYSGAADAASAEALKGEDALMAGEMEVALDHYMAAVEMDPGNGDYLAVAASLGEEMGMPELAIELNIRAVELAVSTGETGQIADLNNEITRLLSVMPGWVQEKLAAASGVAEEQAEGFEAWQEMAAMAQGSLGEGDAGAALETQESALMVAQEVFGESHWITASSYRDLGYLYRQLAMGEEAEQFYSMALAAAQEALGEDHPQTLEIQGLLAELYGAMSAFDEAGFLQEVIAASYEASLGSNNAFTLASRLALVGNYEARGMYADASALMDELCQTIAQTYGTYHLQNLDCLRRKASILNYGGDLAGAAQGFGDSVNLMANSFVGLNTMVLDTLSQLAEVYRQRGDYQQARELLLGIADAALQIGDPDSAARARSYLARVFNNDGDFDRAEALNESVLAYAREHWEDSPQDTYNIMLELGATYQNQGKLAEAEQTFEEALSGLTVLVGGSHQSTLVAMNNLGQVYEKEGLYDLAEPVLKEALARFEGVLGEGHPQSSRARSNLALLYESQGNFREAEPLYLKTLAIMQDSLGEHHNDTIAVRNNLAFLYMLMEEYDQAEPLFAAVHDDWNQLFGEDHQNALKAKNNLARVYHRQNRLDDAEPLLLRALELRRSTLSADHLDTLRSMIDLGSLYLDQGKLEQADQLLEDAVSRLEENYGEHFPYTFEALNTLARVKEERNLLSEALEVRERGFARRSKFLDRMLWVTGENARDGYIRLHRPELDQYLSLLARIDSDDAGLMALGVSLQRKGLLLKVTSEIQQIAQLSEDPELTALAQELELARKELASLTLSGPTPETQGRHTEALYALEQKVNAAQGRLGRASVRYRSSIAEIDAGGLAEALEEDTVLVDFQVYSEGDERKLLAAVIRKESGEVSSDLVKFGAMDEIESVILDYRTYIQDEDADEDEILEIGQLAYDTVWGPIVDSLGDIEHVYLIPDGVLNILPFNALVDEDESYLIQTHDLHIITSGRDLLPNSFQLAQGDTVILAGPDYDSDEVVSDEEMEQAQGRRSTALKLGLRGGASGLRGLNFDPLPGAEEEGRLITTEVEDTDRKSRVFFKGDAQEMVLAGMSRPPEILHMATHGFFLQADDSLRKRLLKTQRSADQHVPPPGDNPLLRSGMAFAGINTNAQFLGDIDTVNDGVLTALEVLSLNLTGTRLVVLSACETGLGEIHEGEGVYGLRRSFQQAGVAEVVSSLWEVSDAGTQALMTDFYGRILKGEPAREALRATQLDMLDSPEWGYPYIWSAFMIVGSYESAGYALQ